MRWQRALLYDVAFATRITLDALRDLLDPRRVR